MAKQTGFKTANSFNLDGFVEDIKRLVNEANIYNVVAKDTAGKQLITLPLIGALALLVVAWPVMALLVLIGAVLKFDLTVARAKK